MSRTFKRRKDLQKAIDEPIADRMIHGPSVHKKIPQEETEIKIKIRQKPNQKEKED
jgi:hypothetical protein